MSLLFSNRVMIISRTFFVFALSSVSFVVNGQDTIRLEERVRILEQYKQEVLDERFDAKAEQLEGEIHQQLEQAKNEVTDQLRALKITGIVIGLILAIGIGAVLANLRKFAEKALKKRLENHLKDNTHYIIDLISSQRTENLIKLKKKILVVSGDESENDSTLRLLKGMQFVSVESKVVRSYERLPDSDLIVFSNKNGLFPDELIVEFMEKGSNDDCYVFFGARLKHDTQASYSERINFANSKFTLYHQIINTLSFKEVFKII